MRNIENMGTRDGHKTVPCAASEKQYVITRHDIEYSQDFEEYKKIFARYIERKSDGNGHMTDRCPGDVRAVFVHKLQVRREEVKGKADEGPALKDRWTKY